jgi:hypothetical protein
MLHSEELILWPVCPDDPAEAALAATPLNRMLIMPDSVRPLKMAQMPGGTRRAE